MLVLSRKRNQVVRIGDDVVLTVLQIDGNRVRLGIEAPTSVPIMRSEPAPHRQSTRALQIVPRRPK